MSYLCTTGKKLLLVLSTTISSVTPPHPTGYAYVIDREGNYGRDREEAFGVVKI